MTKFCGNCGGGASDNARFCPGCGAALAQFIYVSPAQTAEGVFNRSVIQQIGAINIGAMADDKDTYIHQGNLAFEAQDYQLARQCYDRVLAINPDCAEAWYGRAGALSGLRHYQEAVASYDNALALAPNNANAWNNRGFALRYLGRLQEAQESFKKARELLGLA